MLWLLVLLVETALVLSLTTAPSAASAPRRVVQENGLPEGFSAPERARRSFFSQLPSRPQKHIRVTSLDDLKAKIKSGYMVKDLDVRGDVVSSTFNVEGLHPVVQLVHRRRREGSKVGRRQDAHRVAIAVEGGGMRGCVSAGMITAIWYLGLSDAIDVVYGSSAGALIGAYFIADQLPYTGPEIYYDVLTSAGKNFIDKRAMLRSMGLGALDLSPKGIKSLFTERVGGKVLNLHYLFNTVVKQVKPLDWPTFFQRQQQPNGLPLKVVASGLQSRGPVVLSAAEGNFQSLDELAQCIKSSMLLPGITGEPIQLKGRQVGENVLCPDPSLPISEPLVDALLFEPIPYRSALAEGCSHVIAFRTRADDVCVTPPMSFIEKMIMTRFFSRKLGLPDLTDWMHNQYHKLLYAEDMLRLNDWQRDRDEFAGGPKVFTVALPPGVKEIGRMEDNRRVIFENVRQGFAAAYDLLVEDIHERGRGMEMARKVWPDSILDVPVPPLPVA